MKCGEQGLLPKVRELDEKTIVVADGFSCKTQIEQGKTGRRALHVAQVLKLAREHGESGPPGPEPERLYYEVRPKPSVRRRAVRAGAVVALVVGAATLLRREAP
jgi:ferric-dicitrate binding protein FerR (iron transport regulator)